jgi:hypothetical protein
MKKAYPEGDQYEASEGVIQPSEVFCFYRPIVRQAF